MNIVFTARKTTLREPFKDRAEKKLAKFDRFFDEDANATVLITSEKGRETVEVTIHAAGMIFRAEKTTPERMDSLEAVTDALFRQIIKNKSKLEKRFHSQAFTDLPADLDTDGEQEPSSVVVKSKTFSVKPMTAEEAILQMNLLGHTFFIFLNAQTGNMNVVYSRRNGDYGLLIPETD